MTKVPWRAKESSGGWESGRRRVRRVGRKLPRGLPSAAALSSPAKPLTIRGTDQWTKRAKDD